MKITTWRKLFAVDYRGVDDRVEYLAKLAITRVTQSTPN